ncbi:MAG: hypothetical protein GIW97_08945 [Candidatus Eremiobacteraeota bacterium]|nr:hypothetical protein [Candidatus Eremiobacteraeota bacterium]
MKNLALGATAGAAGTMALDIVSYLDMASRGRSPSDMPAKTAQALAALIGLRPEKDETQSEEEKNRWSAIGALMGYAVGIGVGAAYGVLHPYLRSVPLPIRGIAVGAAAMAASDIPMVRLHLTDPTKWRAADWLSDIIPHLAYGIVTAVVCEEFG